MLVQMTMTIPVSMMTKMKCQILSILYLMTIRRLNLLRKDKKTGKQSTFKTLG
jgi:hypothetical protein